MKAAMEGERQDLKANEKNSVCLYMILVMNTETRRACYPSVCKRTNGNTTNLFALYYESEP
jgi:hypothetical protein